MRYKLISVYAFIVIPMLALAATFGSYVSADDEGYAIRVIRSVAEGVPLYTRQFDFHGPLPFLAKATIFRSFGIPIDQNSVRFWVIGIWFLSCAFLSTAIWQITRNKLTTAVAIVVTGTHLFPLRFNPGHPEDFVVLFLSLAILVASLPDHRLSNVWRVALLASFGGVLAATKINVAIFYFLGFALWMLASMPKGRLWKASATIFALAAVAVPALLMRSFLWESWQLLFITTVSIAILCAAFLRLPIPASMGWKHAAIACASLGATVAAVLTFAAAWGSQAVDVLHQTIVVAATHTGMIVRPIFDWKSLPIIPVFGFVAFAQWKMLRRPGSERLGPPGLLKIVLALMALTSGAILNFQFYMPLIAPICWLLVFPDGRTAVADRSLGGRLFVSSIAVFQTLQVFPIKGAQTAWSTLSLSICCLVLLTDGVSELAAGAPALMKRVQVCIKAVAATTVFLLTLLTVNLSASYLNSPSMGFSGADLVRIPMATKASFDWLASSAGRYCDAVVTEPGLDSIALWSSRPGSEILRRSPVLLVDWPITMPEEWQKETVAKLAHASRVCGVYNKRLLDWWDGSLTQSGRARVSVLPLASYMQRMYVIRDAGDYQIRGNASVRERWTDDYLLNGVREFEGGRSAIGVPTSLLAIGPAPELSFEFQLHGTGPLISVQEPAERADDEPFKTEPLVYVPAMNELAFRLGRGLYTSKREAVGDGAWHELTLQREPGRWRFVLDDRQLGYLDDFMMTNRGPHYLEIGPTYASASSPLRKGWHQLKGKVRDVKIKHGNLPEPFSARATK